MFFARFSASRHGSTVGVMLSFIRFLRQVRWHTVKKVTAAVVKRRLTGLSAEIAFNAMLGLFPAIITIVSAISVFENSVAETLGSLTVRFAELIPLQVWNLLLNFTENAKVDQGKSWFSLSFIAAIWIISGAIGSTMNAIDSINQVPQEKRRPYWKKKGIAILLTFGTIVLLISACFLVIVGDFLLRLALQQNWDRLLLVTWKIFSIITIFAIIITTLYVIYQIQKHRRPQRQAEEKNIVITITIAVGIICVQLVYSVYVFVQGAIVNFSITARVSSFLVSIWRLVSFPVALGIIVIAFASIYHFGCSKRSPNIPLLPGAVLSAISWAVVSAVFRYYVANFGAYNRIYGALGTAIVLLLWLYLSALVMLIGEQANLTVGRAILDRKADSQFKPFDP